MKAIPLLRLDAGRKARDEDPGLFFPIAAQSPGLDQVPPRKAACRRCAANATCLTFGAVIAGRQFPLDTARSWP